MAIHTSVIKPMLNLKCFNINQEVTLLAEAPIPCGKAIKPKEKLVDLFLWRA